LGIFDPRRYRIDIMFGRAFPIRPIAERQRSWWPFACVGCLVATMLCLPWDGALAKWLNLDQWPGDVRRIVSLSEIFGHGFGVFLAAWCVWTMSPHLRLMLPRFLTCAFLPGLAANLLKLSIARLRPTSFGQSLPEWIGNTWTAAGPAVVAARNEFGSYAASSFPSGHTATAVGLAIGLSWLYPSGRSIFFSLAILVGLQRISSGAHWPSDVFFGAGLAIGVAGWLFTSQRWNRLFERWEHRSEPLETPDARRAA
jgi:membrane-associated phospholipid phosphatase